jgi:hypothetical protein
MTPRFVCSFFAFAATGLSGCTTYSNLSNYPPFSSYVGRDMPLQSRMFMPDPTTLRTVELKPGTTVSITDAYLKKDWIHGPFIPCLDPTTQIYVSVSYHDPKTKKNFSWNYPIGYRKSLYGYADKIAVAPWEPLSTAQLRRVGRNGKQYIE